MSTFVLTKLKDEAGANYLLARVLGAALALVSLYTLARALDLIKVDPNLRWPPAWALTLIGALGGSLVGLTSVGSGTVIMASLLIFISLPAGQLVGLDVMHGALLTTVPGRGVCLRRPGRLASGDLDAGGLHPGRLAGHAPL
jgi:uncharacterized membrane protein YfcA